MHKTFSELEYVGRSRLQRTTPKRVAGGDRRSARRCFSCAATERITFFYLDIRSAKHNIN